MQTKQQRRLSSMQTVPVREDLIKGAVSVERTSDGLRPWRIPHQQRDLFDIDGELSNAGAPAGVRLRFVTDSKTIALQALGGHAFDLVLDNRIVSSVARGSESEAIVFQLPADLPSGRNTFEIWLDQSSPVWLQHLELEDGAMCDAVADLRCKWITYGSSITQCNGAHSPARTWPATAARKRDLNLTCLGFSGQCHLDGMVGRAIRDLPADVITIKCGINIQGRASLDPRTFRPAIINMVATIREKHPSIPLGVISPIISPPRETTPNAVGYSLELMREHLADAVERLRRCGDQNVHYFDGLSVFGEQETEYLPDDLHPNADGYELLGRHVADRVLAKLSA
jgi:lysophospholipase L1-like esterase